MSAEIIPFPGRWQGDALLSKRQLARKLGRSTRWVELRMAEGLPSHESETGQKFYDPYEVDAWLGGGSDVA